MRTLASCVALVALAACGGGEASPPADPGSGAGTPDGAAPPGDSGGAQPDGSTSSGGPDGSPDTALPDGGSGLLYDDDGPIAFATTAEDVTNGSRTFTEHVYMPSSPGKHPLVSLSPGLLQPAIAYAAYASRLASYGVAVIVRDDPGVGTLTSDVEADVSYAVATWLPSAHADAIDFAKVGLAGHSRGGKATLISAERGLQGKVVAWFGLDPVDATTLNGGEQALDTIGTIGIPTTYLGASVSSSCSPASVGYTVLYPASPSPSVSITGVGAGHTQLQDQANCNACAICTPAGTADPKVVLAYAVRYMTAFFARELLGDARVGAAFEGAGAPTDVAAGRVQVTSK